MRTALTFVIGAGALITLIACIVIVRHRISSLLETRSRLLAQALDAEQRERKRLAYELHDRPIQALLTARRELAATRARDLDRRDRILAAIDLALSQLRETSLQLQPLALEQDGLRAAVELLAAQHPTQPELSINVWVDPEAEGTQDQVAYTVCRELLTNAIRHGVASVVEITIEREAANLIVEVSDDGGGIPDGRLEQAFAAGHLGIPATADRVRALDGDLTIDTAPGRGTVVRARIPLTPDHRAALTAGRKRRRRPLTVDQIKPPGRSRHDVASA
jgi:two-component system NarL family sensor kinase